MRTLLGVLRVAVYFSPTIAAVWRKRTDPSLADKPLGNIVVINLFLGWTIVGWFVAWYMVITKRFGPTVTGALAKPGASAVAQPEAAAATTARPCPHCGGQGRMTCPTCGGQGSEYAQPGAGAGLPAGCTACSRTGRITCYHCHGMGWSS